MASVKLTGTVKQIKRHLKSPAEERLITAALWRYRKPLSETSWREFGIAARAVARERKKPGAMSAKKE